MGVGKKTARKRAVGTREHIIAYLTEVGELFDANGMASTQLAAAVGYPGSSVAFAQLLSGMERSGLIEREVRGKRTYRIRLGSLHGHQPGASGGVMTSRAAAFGVAGVSGGPAGFDYDELARRLLVQVVRRLAATEPDAGHPARSALEETVTGLEYELADAWTKHGKLAEENVRLREQLRAAQRSLALAAEQVGRLPAGTDLDSREIRLLQRLLAGEGPGEGGVAAEAPAGAGLG